MPLYPYKLTLTRSIVAKNIVEEFVILDSGQTLSLLALFEDIFVREFWWIIPLRAVHNWRESSKVMSPKGIFSPAIRAQESLYKWLLKTDQSDYRKLMIFCLFYFLCCQPVYIAVRIWFDRQFSYRTKRDSEHCYWLKKNAEPKILRSNL